MLRIGVVQASLQEGKVKDNCRHLEDLIAAYSKDFIDLLCFPELCVSGYDYSAAAASDREAEFFSEMAAKYKIAILAGLHILEDGKHYDACGVWDETGECLGEYKKIHLWDTEYEFFEKGEALAVVPFKGWNLGLLICADCGFTEVSSTLAMKYDADVIIYPSAWDPGWDDLLVTCCKMRVAENQVYAIITDRATGDKAFTGNTTVAGPKGETILRLQTEEEAYGEVTLYKEKLEEARKAIPWRVMRRKEIYPEL